MMIRFYEGRNSPAYGLCFDQETFVLRPEIIHLRVLTGRKEISLLRNTGLRPRLNRSFVTKARHHFFLGSGPIFCLFVCLFRGCWKRTGIEKSSTFMDHDCIGLWVGYSSSRRTGPYNQNSIPHHVLPSNSARVQKIPALATALISLWADLP